MQPPANRFYFEFRREEGIESDLLYIRHIFLMHHLLLCALNSYKLLLYRILNEKKSCYYWNLLSADLEFQYGICSLRSQSEQNYSIYSARLWNMAGRKFLFLDLLSYGKRMNESVKENDILNFQAQFESCNNVAIKLALILC